MRTPFAEQAHRTGAPAPSYRASRLLMKAEIIGVRRAARVRARSTISTSPEPGQTDDNSTQVTVRPPRRPETHRVARDATISRPRPRSASRPAGPAFGIPVPLRSLTSMRTLPSPARTATVTVSPGAPDPECCTLFPNSSLFTELPDWFSQVRGHADGCGVRDFYLRAGYVLLPCSRRLGSPATS